MQKDLPDLAGADICSFKQYPADETVLQTVQILIYLNSHRLMELGCGYKTHIHCRDAETLLKLVG